MKALELAEKLEQQFPIGTAQHYLDGEAAAELRRLATVEADCAPYLKEGETPAARIKRDLGDSDSLMSLYRDVVAERDALMQELEGRHQSIIEMGNMLTEIVNLIRGEPEEGTSHSTHDAVDLVRGLAMHNDLYATAVELEVAKLKEENERLTNCLKKANDQAEDFERRWYLVDMELERIKALEPVALDHIACICDGELRYMSGRCAPVHDCELYAMPEGKAAPALYALGSKTS